MKRGINLFYSYLEYAAYMDRVHPGKARLDYRAWLDYGWRK